jgi:hypothetical protein
MKLIAALTAACLLFGPTGLVLPLVARKPSQTAKMLSANLSAYPTAPPTMQTVE